MSELIRNKEDLINWFNSREVCCKEKNKEAFVSTKLRKEVMTDPQQGKAVFDGTVKRFDFKNLGGGVWLVTLKGLTE